ncbi:cathelicidin-2-like [Pogona vitticeps]
MELFLVTGALLVALGAPGGTSPLLEDASSLAPLDAARIAVDDYNAEPGVRAVFRLLKLKHTHKTRFGWGLHFSMNFTIKETHCQKASSYRMGSCRYKANGAIRDCSAEVSILNFMHDAPLTSVKCQPAKPSGKKAKPKSRPQAAEALSPVSVGQDSPSPLTLRQF